MYPDSSDEDEDEVEFHFQEKLGSDKQSVPPSGRMRNSKSFIPGTRNGFRKMHIAEKEDQEPLQNIPVELTDVSIESNTLISTQQLRFPITIPPIQLKQACQNLLPDEILLRIEDTICKEVIIVPQIHIEHDQHWYYKGFAYWIKEGEMCIDIKTAQGYAIIPKAYVFDNNNCIERDLTRGERAEIREKIKELVQHFVNQ